jgi:hypothetical protein
MPEQAKSNQKADPSAEHDPDALDKADRKMLLRDDGERARPAKKKG